MSDALLLRLAAWAVHLFTASGAAAGLFALIAAAERRFDAAALWMLVAFAIDSVDGTFARALRVAERIPELDGRRLDDVVDYLNYVIVPVFFLWAAGLVPHPAWLVAPVLASAYGFARVDAKTEDDFFLGFPSYWNVLAIYLWLFEVRPAIGAVWLGVLSVAVFIPFKYLYPSKVEPRSLRWGLGAGGVVWCSALAVCSAAAERVAELGLLEASLVYPAWYFALSFVRGGLLRR